MKILLIMFIGLLCAWWSVVLRMACCPCAMPCGPCLPKNCTSIPHYYMHITNVAGCACLDGLCIDMPCSQVGADFIWGNIGPGLCAPSPCDGANLVVGGILECLGDAWAMGFSCYRIGGCGTWNCNFISRTIALCPGGGDVSSPDTADCIHHTPFVWNNIAVCTVDPSGFCGGHTCCVGTINIRIDTTPC